MENRSSRVSGSQWDILLDFLERNPSIARGYNNSSQGRRESSRLWQEVAGLLNSQGSGTTKTPKEWSTYVSNYKSKIKKIVATNNADAGGTGGGPPRGNLLTEQESRFLAILGPGFGIGAPLVRVDPLPPTLVLQQPSTSSTLLVPPVVSIEEDNVMAEFPEIIISAPTEVPEIGNQMAETFENNVMAPPPVSPPHSDTAPPMPRRQRQRRYRSRPLAPIDEARRILSQVEMQRAAADAASARALELIGQNLGRLADAAERILQCSCTHNLAPSG